MANSNCIIIKVKVKFWFKMYLYGLVLFSYMSGLIPDWKKFNKMVDKGIELKIVS